MDLALACNLTFINIKLIYKANYGGSFGEAHPASSNWKQDLAEAPALHIFSILVNPEAKV